MKTTLFICCILFCQPVFAQKTGSTYPLAVLFNSECCGVPNSKPLLNYIKTFRKKNKLKTISAYRIGPMGREGEYHLAFSLKELNKRQKPVFINGIKAVVATMKDRGYAQAEENYIIPDAGKSCEKQQL